MKQFMWSTVLLIGVALGAYATIGLELAVSRSRALPGPLVKETQATDEQLTEFWFGNGDKASLRKRICK